MRGWFLVFRDESQTVVTGVLGPLGKDDAERLQQAILGVSQTISDRIDWRSPMLQVPAWLDFAYVQVMDLNAEEVLVIQDICPRCQKKVERGQYNVNGYHSACAGVLRPV